MYSCVLHIVLAKLQKHITKKQPQLRTGWRLHDNARPHVMQFLAKFNITCVLYPPSGCFHTHRLFAGAGNGSDTVTGLWVFTHTGIIGTVGQFVFFSDRREMIIIIINFIINIIIKICFS